MSPVANSDRALLVPTALTQQSNSGIPVYRQQTDILTHKHLEYRLPNSVDLNVYMSS